MRPFPGVDRARWHISVDGGTEPVWSRSGDQLYFRTPGRPGCLMSVDVNGTPDFQAGQPRVLFLTDGARGFNYPLYDIDVDDRRFLFIGADTRTDDTRLVRISDAVAAAGARNNE